MALVALSRDGREPDLEGIEVPFVRPGEMTDLAVAEITGETVCAYLPEVEPSSLSDHGRWYIANGYSHACGIKVPPDPGVIVGELVVLWKDGNEPQEQQARIRLRRVSEALIEGR